VWNLFPQAGQGGERKVSIEIMTGKTFLNTIAKGEKDILQIFLDLLTKGGTAYCVVGGLAVNAYVEPVVSLDLDVVVVSKDLEKITKLARTKGFKVEKHEHSLNFSSPGSDLGIQLQTDSRYQPFISRSTPKEILGYRMQVARKEDVLQGKVWAYMEETTRRSKRQKDLADIMRLVESDPELGKILPKPILEELKR
jgi:hypothetical protein